MFFDGKIKFDYGPLTSELFYELSIRVDWPHIGALFRLATADTQYVG
jgi:hypothetical protein